MKKIILQPVDGDNEFKYYFDTVKTPVDLDKIKKHVSQEEYDSLTEIYGSRQVHIWGVPADGDGANASKWDSIGPGDLSLFSREDRIFASAVVTHKIHNQGLASDLWVPEQKDGVKEYIFFLDELKDKNLTYSEFNKIAGYAPDYIIKAFNVLDEQKSSLILKTFVLGKNVVTDKEDIEKSGSTGETETQAEQPSEEGPEDTSTDSKSPETSDSKSETETQAEKPPEEKPEDTSSDSEDLETSDSTSETEPQTESPSEEEPEDTSTDSESLEASDSTSDIETQAEQPPEEEPEETSSDSESPETLDSTSDTETQAEKPSEEEPEDTSTDSESPEASDSTSDTETQAEQPSGEGPEDASADSEDLETSDSTSETETQTEQPSEKKPETTSSDSEGPETSDSKSNTETLTEQPSEEEPEDTSTDSEGLETASPANDTETQVEKPPEEKHEDASSDSEGQETSDSTSKTEPQTESSSEEEPEDTSTDSKSPETSDSTNDIEAPAEKAPEEKPEDISTVSEDQEDFVPIDFKSDTKSQAKQKFLRNMIILTVALISAIGVIKYFIYSDRQQKQHSKQDLQETKGLKNTTPSGISSKYMESGFRKTEWGMTKEQVKAIEHIEIAYENDTAILYYGLVAGMEAAIYYTFAEGKLVESMHRFTKKHIDDNDYILNYKKVKDALTQIYGLPVTDEQLWSDEEYKDDPQDWGFAIRSGDLSFRSSWETDKAKIGLGLYNDNNEIIHGVVHANK